jgi:NADH-ubiquinone oxidoreductase chain 5
MYLTIIALPLLVTLASGLLGRKLGSSGVHLVTCIGIVSTFLLSTIAFFEVALAASPVSVSLGIWLDSELLYLSWGFLFDTLTVSMLLPVVLVSALVHIYSVGYMAPDPHHQRFFAYLSMFTFFMLLLVCGDNFLVMFLGWECVGICSFLLISFWFTRVQATKAAIQAILLNRVGDWLLLAGLFSLLWVSGCLDFATIFVLAPYINGDLVTLSVLALLAGAIAKSAQFGLNVWLPNAMEAPTPVSALLHAATMVTAGVFLLMRVSPLLEYSSTGLVLTLWVGTLSVFLGASIALVQNDLKRVIAYSTVSQIGMMVLAIGLSQYNVALFHLVNHAFFKALLFLSAGAVIHSMHDEQDIRKYGGLLRFLPFCYILMLIGSMSLMAVPFLTGFYSKDLIITGGYGSYTLSGKVAYWLAVVSATLTAAYSTRLLYLTFLTNPHGPRANYTSVHEPPLVMAIPLGVLAIFSISFGYFASDLFIGPGSSIFANSLFIHPDHASEFEFTVPLFFKLLPLICTLLGSTLVLFFYSLFPQFLVWGVTTKIGLAIYWFFNQAYYFGLLYARLGSLVLKMGYNTYKVLDKGVLELLGPYGLVWLVTTISSRVASLDSGYIPHYALYMVTGLLFVLSFAILIPDPKLSLLFLIFLTIIPSTNNNSYNYF